MNAKLHASAPKSKINSWSRSVSCLQYICLFQTNIFVNTTQLGRLRQSEHCLSREAERGFHAPCWLEPGSECVVTESIMALGFLAFLAKTCFLISACYSEFSLLFFFLLSVTHSPWGSSSPQTVGCIPPSPFPSKAGNKLWTCIGFRRRACWNGTKWFW